jgi:flagellar basal body-associated protein FliL
MLDTTMMLTILIGLMIAGFVGYLFYLQRRNEREEKKAQHDQGNGALRLQAYERLALLCDRIALPNLISRLGAPDITARDMAFLLGKHIRDEFDYNITQQIYVSAEIWHAVKNLKEKNLLLINQVAMSVPAEANAAQLNRAILELLIQQPSSSLHEMVGEAISFEAKQFM